MSAKTIPVIDFYFGLGSRYSYLALSQIPLIEAAGATVRWHPIYSPDLIRMFGDDPFVASRRRGQYRDEYRTEDASRWAAHYGVPYIEPNFDSVDWRRAAEWAVAAQALTGRPDLGAMLLRRCFSDGRPPNGTPDLREAARILGMPTAGIEEFVTSGKAAQRQAESVEHAASRDVFGVPTFVFEDGARFWGQDRIPLLVDHVRKLVSAPARL